MKKSKYLTPTFAIISANIDILTTSPGDNYVSEGDIWTVS